MDPKRPYDSRPTKFIMQMLKSKVSHLVKASLLLVQNTKSCLADFLGVGAKRLVPMSVVETLCKIAKVTFRVRFHPVEPRSELRISASFFLG